MASRLRTKPSCGGCRLNWRIEGKFDVSWHLRFSFGRMFRLGYSTRFCLLREVLVQFSRLHRRIKEDVAVLRQLMQCRSPADMHRVYSDYFETAFEQYQEQSASGAARAIHCGASRRNGRQQKRGRSLGVGRAQGAGAPGERTTSARGETLPAAGREIFRKPSRPTGSPTRSQEHRNNAFRTCVVSHWQRDGVTIQVH